MHAPFKTIKQPQNIKQTDQDQQQVNLRLQRQMKITNRIQAELAQSKEHLIFCQNYLQQLKQQHHQLKQHSLFAKGNHFGGWQTKIKQLTIASMSNQNSKQQLKNGLKVKKVEKVEICSQKKHLQQILDQKMRQTEQQQICKLQQKLKNTYIKIQKMVMEEYMNDKVMNKIRKEGRKASKLKTIQFLEKEIGRYNNWVQQNTDKINSQIVKKQVEQKIVFNWELMKLLMTKKIINNDYIYREFVEKQADYIKNIHNIDQVSKKIFEDYNQKIRSTHTTQFSNEIQNNMCFQKQDRSVQSFDFRKVTSYLNQVQASLHSVQNYEQRPNVEGKCQQLNRRLDQLLLSQRK